MRRRHFIRGGLSALLIPGTTLAAIAEAPGSAPGGADLVFYDHRFPEALRLASALGDASRLTPVHGDMTDVWRRQVREACRMAPVDLAGVTTESFHFCLQHMVKSVTHMNSTISRVGRDLYLWHIQTCNDRRRLTGI